MKKIRKIKNVMKEEKTKSIQKKKKNCGTIAISNEFFFLLFEKKMT